MAREPQNKASFSPYLVPWLPLLAFVLLAALIGAASRFVFEYNKRYIVEGEIQNLGAIADLKVAQITAWGEANRRRAELFLQGSMLPGEFELWLREGMQPNRKKQQILHFLAGVQKVHGYKAVSLLDAQGAVRLSTNDGARHDADEIGLAQAAMRDRKVLFLDFHRNGTDRDNPIELGFAAPLVVADRQGGHVVGAVLLLVDPASFLYPMIGFWPTQSRSAETMLVRRDGDQVLFLNELRHRGGAPLSFHLPVATPSLVVGMWLRGQHDPMEGVDYRGVPVVSAVRQVPETPWVMVAKIDKGELLAPILMLQRWVTSLALLFSAGGGVLIIVWHRAAQARAERLKAERDAAVEREALIRHFDYLSRFANDIVLLTDAHGRIVEANDRAAAAYGYSAEELRVMSILGLLRPGANLLLDEIKKTGGMRFESVHVRKDKSEFPVEVSVRAIAIEGKTYYQGIIRDITERRRAADELNESNRELQRLAAHLEVVREEEQKRIARELHDGMGGALAALNMKVSLLAAHPPAKRAALHAELDALARLIAGGVQVMRQIVTELRPCLFDEAGLKSAIECYVREFQGNTGIECDLRLPEEELKLDEKLSTTLFRIMQESLTNVAKHAEASQIGIVLSTWDESLMLTIKDNGKGFDPRVRKAKSFGLIGIRERAAMLGGKAEITSAPGKGTTVRVRLPRGG
ncbi:MAG: PAS domain S-box protein [Sulfuricella sp.]|nr:PAS domain S-box protein [Sulfuricella sp.]